VPHVIVTHPLAASDNARLFSLFGAVFGREQEASALIRELADAIAFADETTRALPREPVLYLIWRKPWMTVARATYVSASLALVGWDTLPAQSPLRYPAIDEADACWREAVRILLSTEPFAFRERDARELAQRWSKPAHLVDGEWTSWYGARAAAGLRALAALRASTAGRECPR
jgi:hypothetical protein